MYLNILLMHICNDKVAIYYLKYMNVCINVIMYLNINLLHAIISNNFHMNPQ